MRTASRMVGVGVAVYLLLYYVAPGLSGPLGVWQAGDRLDIVRWLLLLTASVALLLAWRWPAGAARSALVLFTALAVTRPAGFPAWLLLAAAGAAGLFLLTCWRSRRSRTNHDARNPHL